MDGDQRTAILEAAVLCAGRHGLARTTMDATARQAGVSRATVYRYFPGGHDGLISEAISFEVERFFTRLAIHVDDAPDFATLLERGLMFAHRAIAGHQVLQRVLETEPQRLLPQLTSLGPLVLDTMRDYLTPLLAREELRHGVTPGQAADWLARNVLSFIMAAGRWDLDDPADVRMLVRDQLLAGVLTDP